MRRGDVVTVADRAGEFTGKPRPALVVQSDLLDHLNTVTVCPITSVASNTRRLRFELIPSDELPLTRQSWIEVDKVTTVSRKRLGASIGRVSTAELSRVTSALAI